MDDIEQTKCQKCRDVPPITRVHVHAHGRLRRSQTSLKSLLIFIDVCDDAHQLRVIDDA